MKYIPKFQKSGTVSKIDYSFSPKDYSIPQKSNEELKQQLWNKQVAESAARQANNTTSEMINGRINPNAKMGLEMVSPEFQIMTAGVGALGKAATKTILGKIGASALHGSAQGAIANVSNLSGSEQTIEGLTGDTFGGAIGGAALRGIGLGAKPTGKYLMQKAEPYLLGDSKIPMSGYNPNLKFISESPIQNTNEINVKSKTSGLIDNVLNIERKISNIFEKPVRHSNNKIYMSELQRGYKGKQGINHKEYKAFRKEHGDLKTEWEYPYYPYSDDFEKYVRDAYIAKSKLPGAMKDGSYSNMYYDELGPFSLARQSETERMRRNAFKTITPIASVGIAKMTDNLTGNIATNTLTRRAGLYDKELSRNDTIINLTGRDIDYVKNGEVKRGRTIIGGEFIERSNNSVKKARDFSSMSGDETFGDKNIKIGDIHNFYGVENGKLKIGSLNEFDKDTEIVPIRFNSDKIISDVGIDSNGLTLIDKNGDLIYHNIKGGGKVILYDKTTGNKQFVYSNTPEKSESVIKDFMKNNKNTQIITLDNGRYNHFLDSKDGLKPEDFVKYSTYDFKRAKGTGYNLILK